VAISGDPEIKGYTPETLLADNREPTAESCLYGVSA
jgi:hypothetical protein